MRVFATVGFVAAVAAGVMGESHTVTFQNRCGRGTPQLIQAGNVLSSGAPFTSNGPLSAAIAYLQTGQCLLNGEKCTTAELTLKNPTSPGAGSSADISLIPPHAFSVATGFTYNNGCSNGTDCTNANCPLAFRKPDDNFAQIQCEANNAGLLITFC